MTQSTTSVPFILPRKKKIPYMSARNYEKGNYGAQFQLYGNYFIFCILFFSYFHEIGRKLISSMNIVELSYVPKGVKNEHDCRQSAVCSSHLVLCKQR